MGSDMGSLRRVTEQLSCSAQPDEQWLQLLSLSGVRWIINLGLEHEGYALPGESELVASLGMGYYNLPVLFDAPQLADYQRFCELMAGCEGQPLLVHCAANKRASCFVALWMEQHQGWSREQADHLIASVWQPDPQWQQLIAQVRAGLPL